MQRRRSLLHWALRRLTHRPRLPDTSNPDVELPLLVLSDRVGGRRAGLALLLFLIVPLTIGWLARKPSRLTACAPAFGGARAVLRYLGRYTHRVAISNHRLRSFDGEHVTFQWKDYAHGDRSRTMTLSTMEFLRRFVQHVLPRGFVRIRHFGYLATACRTARLALARTLLAQPASAAPTCETPTERPAAHWHCPRCGAPMIIGVFVTATHLAARRLLRLDSS